MTDFWNCSLWEFAAAVEGWNNKAQGGDAPDPMSIDRYDEILKERGYI